MKVLLTGAFGNIGTSALEELTKRGHQVRCFDVKTKANEKTARKYAGQVEFRWGDLRNPADVAAAVANQDVVLHVAFVIPTLSVTGMGSEADPGRSRAINVDGTWNIIDAIKAQPKPPRLIFTSSLHIYGHTQDQPPPRNIDDPPQPVEHYAQHKVECEQMIRASGLTWAIFRLGAALPLRLVLDPAMFDVPLANRIEFVHTRDVGLALANALETNEVWGKVWHIGGGPRCQIYQHQLTFGVLEAVGVGRLPIEAFTTTPYAVDWLDTTESQRVLQFQRYTLDDYKQDVRKRIGLLVPLIRLFRPIVRAVVLSKSAYWQAHQMRRRQPDWHGKVAVVTGASSGIGAATAERLAREGVTVVLVARSTEKLDDLAVRIRERGGEADVITADLSDEGECLRVYQQVRDIYGYADVLVNNAGLGWYGYGDEMPWSMAREMIEVNAASVARLTLLFMGEMKRRNRGHIVNIGSIVGSIPSQGTALYAATKSFIDTMTTSLYRELRGTNVRISVVRAGAVDTPFFDKVANRSAGQRIPFEQWHVTPERVADRIWQLLRRPRRIAYVPSVLSIVPWIEMSFGWLMDSIGPLHLRMARNTTK
ncbi:MAG: SDR family NAD(P)-dependent oxidoreductase [Anaerolineae bacterium]|nr:SDR family NAD(P)-dependent oxidoreductase [Anaerolineae bacterium]